MSAAVQNFGAGFTTLAQEEGYNLNVMMSKVCIQLQLYVAILI